MKVIINHPFVDGNKRTALLAMLALLQEYKIELRFDKDELYDFIIAMSTGQNNFEQIVVWLNSKKI